MAPLPPETVLPPYLKVIPVSRKDWLAFSSADIMPAPGPLLGVSSRIIVASVTVGLQDVPTTFVAPWSVIPFVIFRTEGQLNVPAGSVIVSPSRAALTKACRLASEPFEK